MISGGSRISQGMGRQPLSLGQKPIIWQDQYQKLQKNEKEIGRELVPNAPLDPPMPIISKKLRIVSFEKLELYGRPANTSCQYNVAPQLFFDSLDCRPGVRLNEVETQNLNLRSNFSHLRGISNDSFLKCK